MARCNSRRPELIAHGHAQNPGLDMLRSNVYLPTAIFVRVRTLAREERISFSATIRGLIADGLARKETSNGPA